MAKAISEIIARRTDLGTFLVHLTRGEDPRGSLESILKMHTIEARNPFGPATQSLRNAGISADSQRCVCFTETPLEHSHLLLEQIEGRKLEFAPYGIALPKKVGRRQGINPVWYIDITLGRDWLMNPINALIEEAIKANGFLGTPIARISPFIEQMGTRADGGPGDYRKEFWWEREWRCCGNLPLPSRVIVLCPEPDIPYFSKMIAADEWASNAACLDPRWGLEQIIARLAGFSGNATDIF
jgi:hypothetical protein